MVLLQISCSTLGPTTENVSHIKKIMGVRRVISDDNNVPSNTLFLSLSEQYISNNEVKDPTMET